jgi:hypothetical protein
MWQISRYFRLTVLRSSWVRISAFLRSGFPFEYMRHKNINPLLRNIQAEQILPWQQILLTVNCFLSNQLVAMEDKSWDKVCYFQSRYIWFERWISTARSQFQDRRVNSQVELRRIVNYKLQVTSESLIVKSVSGQPSEGEDIKRPPWNETSGGQNSL